MPSLADRIRSFISPEEESRSVSFSSFSRLAGTDPEYLLQDFASYVQHGYRSNGPVFSAIQTRALALSEVEFGWRLKDFTWSEAEPPQALRTPWPGGTTGQLVTQIEVDVSLAGAAYIRNYRGRLVRLRPDYLEVISGAKDRQHELQGIIDVLGYRYWPEGKHVGDPIGLLPKEVAAIVPMPDPLAKAPVIGQSWIRSVAQEVDSDSLMTQHRARFYTNAAVPAMAVMASGTISPEQRAQMKELFQTRYEGWENAYRTMFLEGVADVKAIGNMVDQVSFSQVQGAGETRIATASGVPAVLIGFSEGLQAATYSNYSQAMRRFADLTCRPLWRIMCDSLSPVVGRPPERGARLWYDDRRVAFLQQDAQDAAKVQKEKASTIETLIRAGYQPDTVVPAVETNDYGKLIHTGLTSVQLNPPEENVDSGTEDDDPAADTEDSPDES